MLVSRSKRRLLDPELRDVAALGTLEAARIDVQDNQGNVMIDRLALSFRLVPGSARLLIVLDPSCPVIPDVLFDRGFIGLSEFLKDS